jgi:hypothetical protein
LHRHFRIHWTHRGRWLRAAFEFSRWRYGTSKAAGDVHSSEGISALRVIEGAPIGGRPLSRAGNPIAAMVSVRLFAHRSTYAA